MEVTLLQTYSGNLENLMMTSIANIGGSHARIAVSQEGYQGFYSLHYYISLYICITLFSADKFLSYSRNKDVHFLADKNEASVSSFSVFLCMQLATTMLFI